MRLVLDAGALIALERGNVEMWRRVRRAHDHSDVPVTHGGVVGQAWRGTGPRQALLARALANIEVRPLDDALGRAAGRLLANARASDVIDAAVVLLAHDDDTIVTSDPDDLTPLIETLGRDVEIVVV